MITTALLIGAFTCSSAQAILYSQDFEGSSNDIYADGWEVVNLYAGSPVSGIFNQSPSIQAMGFTGKTIGASTFDVIGTTITHVPLTDVAIKSKEYALPAGPSLVTFRLGSIAIGATATSHYSVYIMTAAELAGLGSTASLKACLDAKSPAATATVWGQSSIVSLNLTSYAGQTVALVFRLHNSPTNSFMLFDDLLVKGGTLDTADFDAGQFLVYPNPASSIVTVQGGGKVIKEIYIMDNTGRILKRVAVQDLDYCRLDIQEFSAGLYYISIHTTDGNFTHKLVKE